MKRLLLILAIILGLAGQGWCAPTNFGTASKTYRLGPRNIVRTAAGVPYAVLWNQTDDKVEAWKYATGSWSNVGTNVSGGGNPSNGVACTMDGSDVIHVIYWTSNTVVKYNTFTTGSDAWGTAETIATITTGGARLGAITIDASNIPHAAFTDYQSSLLVMMYANRVGGSWNAAVAVETGINTQCPDITVDTTNSIGHRYNIPQISYIDYTNNHVRAALGAGVTPNNPTSFTLVQPATQVTTSTIRATSIVIDSSGKTTIFSWYNSATHYCQAASIAGELIDTTWGTAGNWTAEANITGASTALSSLSAIADGVNRYFFPYYTTTSGIYYTKSDNYAAWAAQVQLESPAAADHICARWSYANNPSYTTYGIDYLFTAGTGTGNLYWNNLSIAAPATNANGIMF